METKTIAKLCPTDDFTCPHSYTAYSEPSVLTLTSQLRAGIITEAQYKRGIRSACVMCKLDECIHKQEKT